MVRSALFANETAEPKLYHLSATARLYSLSESGGHAREGEDYRVAEFLADAVVVSDSES